MRSQPLIWLFLAAFVCACDDDDDNSNVDDAGLAVDASLQAEDSEIITDSSVQDAEIGENSCESIEAWHAGKSIFTERPGVFANAPATGVRLSVGDIDGDGYPDLAARNSGTTPDLLGDSPKRQVWLLRNTFADRSDDNAPGFEDVSVSSGFLQTRNEYSIEVGRPIDLVIFGDIDNDGDFDIYTGTDSSASVSATLGSTTAQIKETSELLLNDGTGHFELTFAGDVVRTPVIPGGASFVGVNRDGYLDLWVAQNSVNEQDRLFTNDARVEFHDKTSALGLATQGWSNINNLNNAKSHSNAWSATACDLNNDGYPELLAASYGRAPNHLWQGSANGFSNRSVASGYAFDDDKSWQDNQFARCYCQANPTDQDCSGVPAPLITCSSPNWTHNQDREAFRLGGNSAATICADFDNDGFLDLYTTEIKHWWAGEGSDGAELLHNTGEADVRFTRPGRTATGLEIPHVTQSWDEGIMSATAFDFDNDGWLDLYVGASDYPGNRGYLFHNISKVGEPKFEMVAITDFFEHNRSHGVAAADFDRDGDLDLVVGHSLSRCDASSPNNCYSTNAIRYFENTLQSGHWIQLELESLIANRKAVGARVQVTANGFTQTQEISGGYGHYGAQNDHTLHFGLGESCSAEVTIRWPDADLTEEHFTLDHGKRYLIKQGAQPVEL